MGRAQAEQSVVEDSRATSMIRGEYESGTSVDSEEVGPAIMVFFMRHPPKVSHINALCLKWEVKTWPER
jgi:hypothetical protein